MIDPKSLSNWTPYALAVLRIVAGLIFLEHGTQKLLGFPSGERAFVDAMTLSWWAGVFELILGALITLGLFTRGGCLYRRRRDGLCLLDRARAAKLLSCQ